jgi:Domain of unknown function (DUF4387)
MTRPSCSARRSVRCAVAEPRLTVGALADEVRSKNAGPFWITLDIFLSDDRDFQYLIESGVITAEKIGGLYRVPSEHVQIFALPLLHAIKISFPRAVTAGSFEDRDQHAGQQHIPLSRLVIPPRPLAGRGPRSEI